jgi:hypothetical protein
MEIIVLMVDLLSVSLIYCTVRILIDTGIIRYRAVSFLRFFVLFFSVKLVACLLLVWNAEGRSLRRGLSALDSTIVKQPIDTLKVSIRPHESCRARSFFLYDPISFINRYLLSYRNPPYVNKLSASIFFNKL